MFYVSNTNTTDITTLAPDDRELQVLSLVHEEGPPAEDAAGPSHLSQRSIARALGMSVGLTNAILKRLSDKGFLMMRRINAHNVHYLVTPEGIEQISRRSYHYLRRTIGNVVRYKERLRTFCREQKHAGITEIVLTGESDLAFILEWCAQKEGLVFRQVAESARDDHAHPAILTVLSEHHLRRPTTGASSNAVLLHEVVLGISRESS
jgi:DNA-binding MarR family transcriptional regulator